MIYGIHSPAPGDGPGKRLRLGREAANLSSLDVAKQLRLDLNLILALEDDNYSKLPEPTAYVRGYLRAYARMVNVPENYIMESFATLGLIKKAQNKSNECAKDSCLVRYRLGIVLVLAVGAISLLYGRGQILEGSVPVAKPSIVRKAFSLTSSHDSQFNLVFLPKQQVKPGKSNKPWLMPEIQAIIP